ncbi:MAG: ABC transporter ATP-binding protein/permease [Rhodospirillaceae bacterium]|nr:ABC transporter ATP-binding protein/permease [Rhodospirillaceae bacterium]
MRSSAFSGTPGYVKGSQHSETAPLRRLMPYLWTRSSLEMRGRILVALAMLLGAKIANIYIPIVYKYSVDALTPGAEPLVVAPVAVIVAYGLVRVLQLTFTELRDIVFVRVAQHAIHDVGLQTFRHLHRLAMRFHLDRQTGGLSRAIERGTTGIDDLLYYVLFQIFPTILELLMVCAVVWGLYDFTYALVILGTIVTYVAFTLAVTQWRIQYRRHMVDAETEANSKAVDSLLNYETVKYFGNEEHEARRFDVALARYEKAAVISATTLAFLNFGQGFIISVGLIAVMWMAAAGVVQGSMTVGDFVLVNLYLIQLYQPLNFLGMVYRNMRQSLIDMAAMFALLDVHAEIEDRPGAPALRADAGEVVFDAVRFGYDPRRPILHDLSFKVPAGKTVAIVGSSGAGKSTISRLLFRFYDVDEGSIRIDGQDIREVTQASLRAAIGIVPQDTVLFNDTIYYNIAYGRPAASQAEVEEAAKLARIHDFVLNLPDGYETRVGERGLKLSGGERQRVSIARTILKGPRVLLFDEATSHLDTRTEKEIQESLRAISANRTTLIIAHRLSTVVEADEILVVQEGKVVERGNHDDLLARRGLYSAMWLRQLEAPAPVIPLFPAAAQGSSTA